MAPRMSTRYNEVDFSDIIDDYTTLGKSCLEIGCDYDCSDSTIRNLLIKQGVKLRPQGRRSKPKQFNKSRKFFDPNGNQHLSIEKIKTGIQRYTSDEMSTFGLASFWRCSRSVAQKILHYHKIKMHSVGWKPKNWVCRWGC